MRVVTKFSHSALTTINPATVDDEFSKHGILDSGLEGEQSYTKKDLEQIYGRKHNYVWLLFVASKKDLEYAHEAAVQKGENNCVFVVWADEQKKITVPEESKARVINWADFKNQQGQATLDTFQKLVLNGK